MIYNIYNVNLLGDGLMATPAMKAFAETLGPEDKLFLFTQRENHNFIYGWLPFFTETLSFDFENPPEDVDLPKVKGKWVDTKNGKSIFLDIGQCFDSSGRTGESYAQGYARQLGVYPLKSQHHVAGVNEKHFKMATDFYNEQLSPAANGREVVLVSHVSRSCTSQVSGNPPNKMLSVDVWREVTETLKEEYFFVFAAETEKDNASVKELGDVGYMDSIPIFIIGALAKICHILVTVENGIVILGQAVDANMVAIVGAVPISYFWTGTEGEYRILDYGGRGPQAIGAKKIINSIRSITEDIRRKNESHSV